MQKPFAAAEPQIKSYDPIWSQVRREAEEISASEPALGGFIYATVLACTGARGIYSSFSKLSRRQRRRSRKARSR